VKRREFITLLGGAATWPVTAHAQQRMIGILALRAESFTPLEAAFRQGLNEGGFIDGANLPFETRWADGQVDRLPGLAADLVSRRPAVITTLTLPAALAAKAATSTRTIRFPAQRERTRGRCRRSRT
jgi:putative tryptophan/tyrosine transport system substrate-binding protein